jgi:hypothetical protein
MPCDIPAKQYKNMIKNFQSSNKLCDKDNNEIVPAVLSKNDGQDMFLWAIAADDPETIVTFPSISPDEYHPCESGKRFYANGSKRITNMIHHNYLVQGRPVICAGESGTKMGKRWISNKSGHYCPDNDCLTYAKCLFESKGIPIDILVGMKGGNNKTIRAKSKRNTRKLRHI